MSLSVASILLTASVRMQAVRHDSFIPERVKKMLAKLEAQNIQIVETAEQKDDAARKGTSLAGTRQSIPTSGSAEVGLQNADGQPPSGRSASRGPRHSIQSTGKIVDQLA